MEHKLGDIIAHNGGAYRAVPIVQCGVGMFAIIYQAAGAAQWCILHTFFSEEKALRHLNQLIKGDRTT